MDFQPREKLTELPLLYRPRGFLSRSFQRLFLLLPRCSAAKKSLNTAKSIE